MSLCRPPVLLAITIMLSSLLLPLAGPSVSARQRAPEPLDLAGIVLTTADLEDAGLDGYGSTAASPYTLDADTGQISNEQQLDEDDVETTLDDAGYLGSYVLAQHIPMDPSDPFGPSSQRLVSRVYAFAEEDGAADAYALITDESAMEEEQSEEQDLSIGDDAELTELSFEEGNYTFGTPYDQLELEILVDRLVLEVSALDFEPDTRPRRDRVDTEAVLALGERLVERAEAALDGTTPNLWPRTLTLDGDSGIAPYLTYDLFDGEPIRIANETDAAFTARAEQYEEAGMMSLLNLQQFLTGPTRNEGALIYSNAFMTFARSRDAETYLDDTMDRLAGRVTEVQELDLDTTLGDASLGLVYEYETDGQRYPAFLLLIQVDDVVITLGIRQQPPSDDPGEVSPELLTELGEAQLACLNDEICIESAPMPAELAELVDGLR